MSTALYNPQPDGFLALDWSQVIPYGFIPVIQTRTPNASEQPVNQVTISVDSAASVRITAADDASVSRLFDGFRLELQTVNEDLPDTIIAQGVDRKTYRIYFEYAWYYTISNRVVMVEGTLRRVALSVQVLAGTPSSPSSPTSQSQSVQRGGKVTFLVQPQYRGSADSGTIRSLDGPAFDIPYFVGARIRMLPSTSIKMDVRSSIRLSLDRDPIFDAIGLIPTAIGILLSLQASVDAASRSLQFGVLTYKYGYYYCNSGTQVNKPIGINSLFDLVKDENAAVLSLRNKGTPIVRDDPLTGDDVIVSDGSSNWPKFKVTGGYGLIVKLGSGYSSVLCVTRKPVQFGESILYLGKGVIEGPQSGDPRNGVAKSLILDADPLNFSYVTGRELRTYLLAGGKRIDWVVTGGGTRFNTGDGGHTPLFSVNNEVDPTKQYLVVFIPYAEASVDGEVIRTSNYNSNVYITYQDSDDVVSRRINIDIHYYQHRNNITQAGQGLDIVQNRSSLYHFTPTDTVVREIDGLLERCKYASVAALATSVNYFGVYEGRLPTLSTGHNPRSFTYSAYLLAKQVGAQDYSTYAADAGVFSVACSRVAAQDQVDSGRPTVNNPLIPPSQGYENWDLTDTDDSVIGTPISIRLPRISRFHNLPANGRLVEFPKGYFFADSNGIFYMNAYEEKILLFSPSQILNQSWFTENFASARDFTGYTSNIVNIVDMYFDISEACNSCLPDDLKIPYERGLARAISKSSKYDSGAPGSGIGIPRLDFFRMFSSTQSRVGSWPDYGKQSFPDLSLSEFDMKSVLGNPAVLPGVTSVNPLNGGGTFDAIRRAGSLGGIDLSRKGRVIIENTGPAEQIGWPYIITQGTFSGIRASMDRNNRDGVVALRSDDKYGLLHVEAAQSHRALSVLSPQKASVAIESAKWNDPSITRLASPLSSRAAFGTPFDVIPSASKGLFAVVNETDAFKERSGEKPSFEHTTVTVRLSPVGNSLGAVVPPRAEYVIASADIQLLFDDKDEKDANRTAKSSEFRPLFVSVCLDDSFQVANGIPYPPRGSQSLLWFKVDDYGKCRIRGPHYGSGMNLIVSSASVLPAFKFARVSIRWVSRQSVEKWYPDMSSASPFVDIYGCTGMYFTSNSDEYGLSCYWSCDGDMTWNLMTHVMQGFSGEIVSDVIARSDHANLCTYCMFKKDGMLLCKRIDDVSMASDIHRLPRVLQKSQFKVGDGQNLRDFAYALHAEAYRKDGFKQGQTLDGIANYNMKTRLTTAYVVNASFSSNEEYKEEALNARLILSSSFKDTTGASDSVLKRRILVPRIASSHGEDPKYCVGSSGRFDFDPDAPYAFDVLPNGMLFCMMVNDGSVYAFSSSDGGRSWKPAFADLAYPLRPIKYYEDDADSAYNLTAQSASFGDSAPIDGISMCVDKFGEYVMVVYNAEGALYAQRIPCANIYKGIKETVNMFSTAWLSHPERKFMRPFYLMGELPAAAADAVNRQRSFFLVSKTYSGNSSLLSERFGVDFGYVSPALVNLQDGCFRMFYLTADTVRGGFIIGDTVVLDAQLV